MYMLSEGCPFLTYLLTLSEPKLITSIGSLCGWISSSSSSRSVVSLAGTSQSSLPSSLAWLIGNPYLQQTSAKLFSVELFALHVYELILEWAFEKSVKKKKKLLPFYFSEKVKITKIKGILILNIKIAFHWYHNVLKTMETLTSYQHASDKGKGWEKQIALHLFWKDCMCYIRGSVV